MGYLVELITPPLTREVDLIIPEDNITTDTDPRFYLHNCCRPEGIIEEFFTAAPGNLYWFSRYLGQSSCFHSLPVAVLPAKSSSHEGSDNTDILQGKTQGTGYLFLDTERSLGGYPKGDLTLFYVCYRRMSLNRGMGYVAVEIGLFNNGGGISLPGCNIPSLRGNDRARRKFEEMIENGIIIDARLRHIELSVYFGQGPFSLVGVFVEHRDEITITNNLNTSHSFGG